MKEMKRHGFSLVELLIAVAISAIVMASVIALMGYTSRSMNSTQKKVSLQEQAKDAANHISVYVQEGNKVTWDDTKKLLTIEKDTVDNSSEKAAVDPSKTIYSFYYYNAAAQIICFDTGADAAKGDALIGLNAVEAKRHMLVDHVTQFDCKQDQAVENGKQMLHVSIGLKNDDVEYVGKKEITMRNQ